MNKKQINWKVNSIKRKHRLDVEKSLLTQCCCFFRLNPEIVQEFLYLLEVKTKNMNDFMIKWKEALQPPAC